MSIKVWPDMLYQCFNLQQDSAHFFVFSVLKILGFTWINDTKNKSYMQVGCAYNWSSYCDVFSAVLLENCGFSASQFSAINFLQCSEYLFSVLPELIPWHLLESRGLFLCVFSHYTKGNQSVLLEYKLGFTKYKEGQNLSQ